MIDTIVCIWILYRHEIQFNHPFLFFLSVDIITTRISKWFCVVVWSRSLCVCVFVCISKNIPEAIAEPTPFLSTEGLSWLIFINCIHLHTDANSGWYPLLAWIKHPIPNTFFSRIERIFRIKSYEREQNASIIENRFSQRCSDFLNSSSK